MSKMMHRSNTIRLRRKSCLELQTFISCDTFESLRVCCVFRQTGLTKSPFAQSAAGVACGDLLSKKENMWQGQLCILPLSAARTEATLQSE